MNQRVLPRFLAQGHPGEYDGESGAAADIRWNPKVLDEWKKTDGKTNHRETAIRAFSNVMSCLVGFFPLHGFVCFDSSTDANGVQSEQELCGECGIS